MAADNELPLKLVPAKTATDMPMVFIISGDGGWNGFIQSVSECFARKGMPVAALDSRRYFWEAKSPDKAAEDISEAISECLQKFNKKTYILAGFSFGAGVLPFIVRRVSEELKERMDGIYAISPDVRGDFEIHLTDMFSLGNSSGSYDILEEMNKIRMLRPVLIFGTRESESVKKKYALAGHKIITLKGNHNYNNDHCGLADAIIRDTED